MPTKTQVPAFSRWKTAPDVETLRSLYDSSAHKWQNNLTRLNQIHSYHQLFKNEMVCDRLSYLNHTSRILDCGIGTGAFSLALLESCNQSAHVSGIDISYPMLTHAHQILKNRCQTLDLQCGDIQHLPYANESFDVVIFAHVLEHMANPVETLREIVRVLKPGAPLIGSLTRKGLGQALMSLRWQHRGYTATQIDLLMQAAGLENIRTFSYGTGWSKRMCLATIGTKPISIQSTSVNSQQGR